VCSAKVQLRQDGTLRYHLEGKTRCDGSQRPPLDLSERPDDLMSVASILKIGIYEALARCVPPEELADALQPTIREIRQIAAAAQDKLDAALAAVEEAHRERARDQEQLQRSYDRVEARARKGIAGIRAASIAEDGFNPHGFFVYFLWGSDTDRPLYIGKSENVLARLGHHMSDRMKRYRVMNVTLLRCETEREMEMEETETRMIVHHQPPLNTIGIGPVPHPSEGAGR
jgi:hypothetical protein